MAVSHQLLTDAPAAMPVLAGRWDLRQGYHPSLASTLVPLSGFPLFPSDVQQQALNGLDLPVMFATHGHHVMQDAGYLSAAIPSGGVNDVVDEYPLAPVFVRDLCGRTIHTGLTPLPAAPSIPIFPSGCRHLAADHPVTPYIENALFLTWRRIECAPPQPDAPGLAGQPELSLQSLVAYPHQYAYKLRPDTFYADGWRLPQVGRVYAQPVPPVQAQAAAEELQQRWQSRPAGQDYEAFYDANNGEEWFESLFQRGCTVVPTLEAYNGLYRVEADYTASAVDPGRFVHGLHEVVRREASELPEGTILAVEEPGWVTATVIYPAKVIVSDGSGFTPAEGPQPLLPNLTLPHPRVGGQWGAVWLPTHPAHFAEPALWDWDATGHFVQISGPLWDPLHYTYACAPQLARAARKSLEDMPCLYHLPESLKARFQPVIEPTSCDIYNQRTAQQRMHNPSHPLYGSAIDSVPLGKPVTTLGYHPLPWALEYELDPGHLTTLNPRHRVTPCPPQLQERLVPLATLYGEPADYARHQVVVTEPCRQAWQQAEEAAYNDCACDANGTLLPQQWQAAAQLGNRALPSWLPEVPASHLAVNVKRLFAARTYRQALQQAANQFDQPLLPTAFFQFREAALAWRRLRYRLFGKYPATWQQAVLEGLNLTTAEALVPNHTAEDHAAVRSARQHLLGVVQTPLPLPQTASQGVGGGLPSADSQAKLVPSKQPHAKALPSALRNDTEKAKRATS
ncbi:MAG: hypothetical protein EON60_05180 [Alphaproteobacteria bacterium]|nr:MAG: hypothetical protein EON60_05180 [Alphaproteobacteria bacterium]